MNEEVLKPQDGGNGKVVPPVMIQIVFDPNVGSLNVNGNIKDKKMAINLLCSALQVVNNQQEQTSNIVAPKSRIIV